MQRKQNVLVTIVFALLALGLASMASAQTSADGSIGVTIVNQQITLVEDISLSFGTVQPFGRDGTVRITTAGATINSSTFNTVDGNPATWSVTGVPNAPFDVFLPSNSITVSNGTGETMSVTNFNRSGGSQLYIDPNGNAAFNVGATLNVSALQADGTYSGTYNVTVAYN